MSYKETGRKVANIVLRHVATNWLTYLQLIAAILVKDYVHAYIILKKLCFNTAARILVNQAKSLKEKWNEQEKQ